jgi:hypothetical protein
MNSQLLVARGYSVVAVAGRMRRRRLQADCKSAADHHRRACSDNLAVCILTGGRSLLTSRYRWRCIMLAFCGFALGKWRGWLRLVKLLPTQPMVALLSAVYRLGVEPK